MGKTYTKFNIDEYTLYWGFGIELGFVDCSVQSLDDLIAVVDELTREQFDAAMVQLGH